MSQKLQDFLILLKKDRKTQVISLLALCGLLFLVFAEPKRPVGPPKRQNLAAGSGAGPTDERYEDLFMRFNTELQTLQQATHDTSVQIQEQSRKSEEHEKRTAEIFKRLLERLAETGAAVVNASYSGGNGVNLGDGSGAGSIAGMGGADSAANGGIAGGGLGGGADGSSGMGSLSGSGAGSGLGASGGRMGGAQAMNASLSGGDGAFNDGDPDAPESFGFEDPKVAPPPPPPIKKEAIVGAGDSVRVELIAGVNAPTDGTPYPVIFKLTGDVQGPDGSALPIGEARLIAAAQGSLSDSRALFRLSSLNLRLPNGRRKVIEVDGYVVGEDGKLGMEGIMIDPLSKILAAVGLGTGVQEMGKAVAESQVDVTTTWYGDSAEVTGDTWKYAGGRALEGAAREYSSIIKERARQMVPHVEVLSGRRATAVFSQSFVISDLYEALEAEEEDDGSLY